MSAAPLPRGASASARSASRASAGLCGAWRGAACYHYYCLAHRQLYDAQYVDAMKTSIRLSEYENVLTKCDIYSLVALSAYHAKDWYVCSKAFIKLETLDDAPQCDDEKEDYLEEILFL